MEIGMPIGVIVVAVLASGVRVSLVECTVSIKEIISAIGASLFLAVTSHPAITESSLTNGMQTLLIAAVAFFSRDILLILIKLKKQIAHDPLGALREFLNWRRDKND